MDKRETMSYALSCFERFESDKNAFNPSDGDFAFTIPFPECFPGSFWLSGNLMSCPYRFEKRLQS